MLVDTLKEDMKRMEDIACEAGFRVKGHPVRGKTPSQVQWAIAVAVLHIIQWITKQEAKKNGGVG